MFNELRQLRVAILDLYEGQPNEGMRCIREILNQFSEIHNIDLALDEFEVRLTSKFQIFLTISISRAADPDRHLTAKILNGKINTSRSLTG